MSNPFCFECGYDLSCLDLPRPCPECGRLADPTAQAAEAREWFARPSSTLKWLVRPSTIPSGSWHVLYDPTSAGLARVRVACWLWLSTVLAVVTVGVGRFPTAEYDVKVWCYVGADAERTPLRVVTERETDRLFALNLHLLRGGLFLTKPASWVQVVECKRSSVGVSVPEDMEPMFLFGGCDPPMGLAAHVRLLATLELRQRPLQPLLLPI